MPVRTHVQGHVKKYTGPSPAQTSALRGNQAIQTADPTQLIQQAEFNPDLLSAHELLQLQQIAGNRAVQRIHTGRSNLPTRAAVETVRDKQGTADRLGVKKSSDILAGVAPVCCMPHNRYFAGKAVAQMVNGQMAGRPLQIPGAGGVAANVNYPGYLAPNLPAGHGLTGACSGVAWIRTAGENINNKKSNAGPLTNVDDYKDPPSNWSKKGGLLHDPSNHVDKAVIHMHAINHRFDAAALNGVSKNIFLGTNRSNNNHLHKVEMPVLRAISNLITHKRLPGDNAAYETEMARAVIKKTIDKATNNPVLYWPGLNPVAAGIDNNAVKHAQLIPCIADKTNYAAGVTLNGMNTGGNDEDGQALEIVANTAQNNYHHAWVKYQVTPNYNGVPGYVYGNIAHEVNNLAAALDTHKADLFGGYNIPEAAATLLRMGIPAAANIAQLFPAANTRQIMDNFLTDMNRALLVNALPLNYSADLIGSYITAGKAANAVNILNVMAMASIPICNLLPNVERGALGAAGFVPPGPVGIAPANLPGVAPAALPGAKKNLLSAVTKDRLQKLATFPAWAAQAFATNFHAKAEYFTASYKMPAGGELYYKVTEEDDYPTDLQ